jgi:hypothetical protein
VKTLAILFNFDGKRLFLRGRPCLRRSRAARSTSTSSPTSSESTSSNSARNDALGFVADVHQHFARRTSICVPRRCCLLEVRHRLRHHILHLHHKLKPPSGTRCSGRKGFRSHYFRRSRPRVQRGNGRYSSGFRVGDQLRVWGGAVGARTMLAGRF